MLSKMYSIFDSKVGAYHRPFYAQNAPHACRMIADTASDPNVLFHKHPEDFTLFEVGEFDDETGKLESYETFLSCGNVITIFTSASTSQTLAEIIAEQQNLPLDPTTKDS